MNFHRILALLLAGLTLLLLGAGDPLAEARAMLRAGQPATALLQLDQAPTSDETNFLRGVALDRLNRRDEALAAWRAVSAGPRLADAAYFLRARAAVLAAPEPAIAWPPAAGGVTPPAATMPAPVAAAGVRVRFLLKSGVPAVNLSSAGRMDIADAASGQPVLTNLISLRLSAGAGGVKLGDYSPGVRRVRVTATEPVRVDNAAYRGAIVVALVNGTLTVTNHLDLEEFIAGVVGREVSARWLPAALEAQAIAARTFAVNRLETRRGSGEHDLASGDMVYGGVAAEADSIRAAVAATRGIILRFGGRAINAYFSAASGGTTASAREVWGRDLPYLVSSYDPFSANAANHRWELTMSGWQLGEKLRQWNVGQVQAMRVHETGESGRAAQVRVQGSRRTVNIPGGQFRSALGVDVCKSTLFDGFERAGEQFTIRGRGWGHGVGMAQYSAKAMAEAGWTAAQILAFFYPGAALAAVLP